jgi:hypothetical protein
MKKREDDEMGEFRFRADRFFSSQGAWYCNTREGPVLGPFPDRDAAQAGLSEFLRAQGVQPDDAWGRTGAAY